MSIYDRRMVLFTGKGGVGKTTLASAFALSCAMRGQKTLLIELNVKDRLNGLFGSVEVGAEIVELEHNLYGINITPDAAMEEYGVMKLKLKMVYKAVFENRLVSTFLKIVPGLNELLLLGKSHFHATEVDDRGRYVWDKVVIDAPATGHGIFFLKIPSVITSIISAGPMYNDARRIQDFMSDPKLTAINLVTLPEDMPVNETLELREVLENELKMPIGMLVANCVYNPIFDDEESRHMLDITPSQIDAAPSTVQGFLQAGRFRAQRVAMQREYLQRLETEKKDAQFIQTSYHFAERFDFQTIRKIALEIEAQLDPEQAAKRSAG